MKKIGFDQALRLLGNLGVIVGILLLVFELSQSRQMMESQTRNDLYNGLADYLVLRIDPEYVDISVRSRNGEELSQVEQARLISTRTIHFRYMENLHYQYRNGLFDEAEFSAQRVHWQRIFATKPYAEQWCSARNAYAPEFVAEINGSLSTYQCD